MAYLNEHYLKLQAGYLFPEIERRVRTFIGENPSAASHIIRCGIGDVTEPLPAAAIAAMHKAVDELGDRLTFRGYGPATGYDFVRSAIAHHDYRARGLDVADDEVFLSDGSKGDCGAILDILGDGNRLAIPDPVYPVYVDSNVMAGHTGEANGRGGYEGIVYLPGAPANGFVPELPREAVDLIYLCFPNNPTGATIRRDDLSQWVKFALKHEAIILYDAAYMDYIADDELPRSIYEIDGARDCAIEFRSFSKNGGFTGLRCGCTILPKSLHARTRDGRRLPLHPLWMRRWSTKSNGVSYPIQRATEALYTDEGKKQVRALIDHYMGNASVLRKSCEELGLRVWGGANAPYLWAKCPDGIGSWELFDRLLADANVVVTPGAGFGACGEGFFRISAFNSRANVIEAALRLKTAFRDLQSRNPQTVGA